ncbi:MAG: hypothetical protein GF315_04125 [candidate division Zixibacteria bacterium]|nr:hypothetical protein [candidate division Zixibacteria bacterium]
MAKVQLRKFPYPYKAALTIANDLDNMTLDDFLEVRKFLNTDLETSMGRGLSLEIGETFWCYSLLPYEVTYLKGLSAVRTDYADILLELIKAGYLDCFHAYGDFNRWENPENPVYFNRKLAEQAAEEFSRRGIKFDTFINHGDNYNIQNVAGQLLDNRGDIPDQDAYHNDITMDILGVRFYWAGDLTAAVGQERALNFGDRKYYTFRAEHLVKGIAKDIFGKSDRKREVYGNELLRKLHLRDGRVAMEFPRYCYDYRYIEIPPGRDILKIQLSDDILNRLIMNEGYMVIYTHFGQPKERETAGLFDPNLVERFRSLKNYGDKGDIWITTTSRMLRYAYETKFLNWEYDIKPNGEIHIRINGVGGPLDIKPTYQGLTFYVPEPEKTLVYVFNEKVENLRKNPDDGKGQSSVSIPIPSLEFPIDAIS